MHLRSLQSGFGDQHRGCSILWLLEVSLFAFNSIGYKYFIVYAVINAVCAPTIFLLYPETSGKSLEGIENNFLASKSIFHTVSVSHNMQRGEHPGSELLLEQKQTHMESGKANGGWTTQEEQVQ